MTLFHSSMFIQDITLLRNTHLRHDAEIRKGSLRVRGPLIVFLDVLIAHILTTLLNRFVFRMKVEYLVLGLCGFLAFLLWAGFQCIKLGGNFGVRF
jgi:hypothetical protein